MLARQLVASGRAISIAVVHHAPAPESKMPIELGYGKSTSDIENVEWNIGTAQLPNVVR